MRLLLCAFKMFWDNDKCLLLISNYRNKSILWDSKHPQHYNKILKNDAWVELATTLDCSIDDCRRKITSLLASLRREKSKHVKSKGTGKGAEEIYNSSWFAYESLKFVLDKNKPRDGSDSISVEPAQDSTNENVQEHSNSEGPPSQRELSDSGSQSSQRESFNSNKVQRERNKRKRETDDDMMMRSAFDTLQKSANSLNTMNDEFGTFGMFVANKLRKYTENTTNILYSADKGEFDYYDTNMYGGSRGYRTAHSTPSNASTSAVAQSPNQQDTNNSEASLTDLDVMSQLSDYINS